MISSANLDDRKTEVEIQIYQAKHPIANTSVDVASEAEMGVCLFFVLFLEEKNKTVLYRRLRIYTKEIETRQLSF